MADDVYGNVEWWIHDTNKMIDTGVDEIIFLSQTVALLRLQ
jgi:hypothetical protein